MRLLLPAIVTPHIRLTSLAVCCAPYFSAAAWIQMAQTRFLALVKYPL